MERAAAVLLLGLCACPPAKPACAPPSPPAEAKVTMRAQTHMATYVSITVVAASSGPLDQAIDAAFEEVARLESDLSEWRDSSELSALNARAGTTPMAVSEELFGLLELSEELGRKSEGAFDVTFGSLVGLWDFRMERQRVPSRAELAARLPLVDYRRIRLDPRERMALLEQEGARVGLGAIAKGYAVDRASAVLAARGFGDHLIIAGGDGYAAGRRGDRKWRVGIRDPQGGGIFGMVEVADEGFATSGTYEKFFVQDGVRYHHIMDPRTGMPAPGTSSVTVLAPNATLADGWSTALFVLGSDRGRAIAEREGLDALWFDEAFVVSATPRLKARIEPVPTD
jgi:FAD:protein FMN transferase